MIVYGPWDGVLLPWGGAMRSLRSALYLPSLAVSLTVAALVLTACSSDDDSSSENPWRRPDLDATGSRQHIR